VPIPRKISEFKINIFQELQAVRRLLNEDRRRSSGESQKLFDVQTLFGQVAVKTLSFWRSNVITTM